MDPGDPGSSPTNLSWGNVGLAFSFILLNGFLSTAFGLGVGSGLLTSAIRCVVQLSVVALILQKVFETNNPFAVAGMALLLNLMGTMEAGECPILQRFMHRIPHDIAISYQQVQEAL